MSDRYIVKKADGVPACIQDTHEPGIYLLHGACQRLNEQEDEIERLRNERDEARKAARQLFRWGDPFMLAARRLWLERHPWLESEVDDAG